MLLRRRLLDRAGEESDVLMAWFVSIAGASINVQKTDENAKVTRLPLQIRYNRRHHEDFL